ncbi:hypothetical protein [Ehrlichia canis]|uniref:hypothetical protein n=1 Tax=Ehrlichia canis TaxID=944 RepID=UPI001F1B9EBA|nr:hypothetical protein [Ehrlichia canis]UKC53507.1 hypothetical protein s20019040002_000550 [Ehrlichia canis]UKC54446.1 hypothetical protein s20026770001_000552 [Ehrlichia canis]UKC55382.1 hypothetical protein s21009500007_000552 [Ehrlichia canis]
MSDKNQIMLLVLLVLLVLLLILAIYFYCFRYKNQDNINALLQDKEELSLHCQVLAEKYNKLLGEYKNVILAYIKEKKSALEKAGELNDNIISTLSEALVGSLQQIHEDEGIEHDPESIIADVVAWLTSMKIYSIRLLDRSMQIIELNERVLAGEFSNQLSLALLSRNIIEGIKTSKSKRGLGSFFAGCCACFRSQSEPEPEPEPQPQLQVQDVQVDHNNERDNARVN